MISKYSFFDHLCFYLPEKLVGFYGSSRTWFKPYLERNFDYSGELKTIDQNKITFIVNDPYHNDQWHFEGEIIEELLHVKAVRKSNPNKIWLEDVFEYIGMGEGPGNDG